MELTITKHKSNFEAKKSDYFKSLGKPSPNPEFYQNAIDNDVDFSGLYISKKNSVLKRDLHKILFVYNDGYLIIHNGCAYIIGLDKRTYFYKFKYKRPIVTEHQFYTIFDRISQAINLGYDAGHKKGLMDKAAEIRKALSI